MKILIIGGSRVVGPVLVQKLLENNHDLTVFNRGTVSTQYPEGVTFVQGDRNDGFDFDEKFEVVIDMCAYNGADTKKAIEEIGFDYFVNFGTVASYAQTQLFPLTEESAIGEFKAWGDYNKGKVECEKVLKASGLKYGNIRPTYILGEKNYIERESFIYSKILNEEELILPGNGIALAQFVFVDEVVDAIVKLSEDQIKGDFNIVGDDMITLIGLVEMMGEIVGKKPKISFNPEADGENANSDEFPFDNITMVFDNQKSKDVLGISYVSLREGLERDYREYYKNVI